MKSRRRWIALSALSLAAPLHAQLVAGRVVAARDSTPVRDAIALLVDAGDRVAARTLANERGEFRLLAPAAGSYRVRILRIGYRPTTTSPLTVADGATIPLLVVAADLPLQLATIRVSARSECRTNPDSSQAAFAIWSAARTALVATQATRDAGFDVRLARVQRTLDAGSNDVRAQWIRLQDGRTLRPFAAIDAATLDSAGYVVADRDGGMTYYAPDADVLLSDSFAASHCLRAVASSDPDSAALIGVAFEPTRRRDVVDVEGVLWLDRATAALRTLEVRYAGLDDALAAAGAGARVDFARVPGSPNWMVSSWALRMPIVRVERETREPSLAGVPGASSIGRAKRVQIDAIQVTGGAVIDARRGRDVVWSAELPEVRGVVREPGSSRPAVGATVRLRDTDYRATTDSAGAFRITGVLSGTYDLLVSSPSLDSLGLHGIAAGSVAVARGASDVAVDLPTRRVIAQRVCPAKSLEPDGALLHGVVRTAAGTLVEAGRKVVVRWTRAISTNGRLVAENGWRETATNSEGAFDACGVPRDVALTVSVRDGERMHAAPPIVVARDEVVRSTTIVLPP